MAGSIAPGRGGTLDQATREFYQAALGVIKDSSLPFMVGGAYAFSVLHRHRAPYQRLRHLRPRARIASASSTVFARRRLPRPS